MFFYPTEKLYKHRKQDTPTCSHLFHSRSLAMYYAIVNKAKSRANLSVYGSSRNLACERRRFISDLFELKTGDENDVLWRI